MCTCVYVCAGAIAPSSLLTPADQDGNTVSWAVLPSAQFALQTVARPGFPTAPNVTLKISQALDYETATSVLATLVLTDNGTPAPANSTLLYAAHHKCLFVSMCPCVAMCLCVAMCPCVAMCCSFSSCSPNPTSSLSPPPLQSQHKHQCALGCVYVLLACLLITLGCWVLGAECWVAGECLP